MREIDGQTRTLFLTYQDFDVNDDKIPDYCYNPDQDTDIMSSLVMRSRYELSKKSV